MVNYDATTPDACLVRLCQRLGLVKRAKGRYFLRQHGGQPWHDPALPASHPASIVAAAAWLRAAVDLTAVQRTAAQAASLCDMTGDDRQVGTPTATARSTADQIAKEIMRGASHECA